jgi:hypothetical protein
MMLESEKACQAQAGLRLGDRVIGASTTGKFRVGRRENDNVGRILSQIDGSSAFANDA